jgi:acetate kinase
LKVLVVNCGSSSIKYQLYDMPAGEVLAKGLVERIGETMGALMQETPQGRRKVEVAVGDHQVGMDLLLQALTDAKTGVLGSLDEIEAVGHRVVHGAEQFTGSVLITDEVEAAVERVADLAPLHNPPNLTGIRAARHALPKPPQVACFDTAFHTTIPKVAYIYALPYELYEKFGVRRYGFHGTSHRYVARRAAALLGRHKYDINCITCHLGNGCSLAAVKGGKSIDTSMGLTPLEGLVMGTRSGDFDPAILFYLAGKGYTIDDLNKLCNKQSGLLGISGESNDMRTLADLAADGDERAQLALDVFAYRVKKYIGAYAAALGRLDAVIFTGGIGQNAKQVRAACCSELDCLGIQVDPEKNAAAQGIEDEIQSAESRVKVLVLATDEEAAIAADTFQIVTEGKDNA